MSIFAALFVMLNSVVQSLLKSWDVMTIQVKVSQNTTFLCYCLGAVYNAVQGAFSFWFNWWSDIKVGGTHEIGWNFQRFKEGVEERKWILEH